MPRLGPIAVAALTTLALVGSAVLAWSGVRDAATTLARGDAQGALAAAQRQLDALGHRPTSAELEAVRQALAPRGVEFIGIVDAHGAVESGASTRGLRAPLPVRGAVEILGEVVRIAAILGPPRPRPPPPGPGRRRPPTLVLELRTTTARRLEARARITLGVGLAAACLAFLAAIHVERATRERERARADAARASYLSSLGEMSAVVAHELRNPLASLKGHAQLLEETLDEGTAARAKARRVVAEADRIERLTDDLLSFVRAGTIQPMPHDPSRILRESADAARGAHAVTFDVRTAPHVARLDATRVRCALENLVRNAVLASPPDAPVEVSVASEGGAVVFSVKDRGDGFPAGEEARIFEPFHTTRANGTGLGLAVARRVAEAHGGTLVAHRREGGGSSFVMRLPEVR